MLAPKFGKAPYDINWIPLCPKTRQYLLSPVHMPRKIPQEFRNWLEDEDMIEQDLVLG